MLLLHVRRALLKIPTKAATSCVVQGISSSSDDSVIPAPRVVEAAAVRSRMETLLAITWASSPYWVVGVLRVLAHG
jgi:hypothetical protein